LTSWMMRQRTGILESVYGNSAVTGRTSLSCFHFPSPPLQDAPTTTLSHTCPYLPSLTPLPSFLWPHCLACHHLHLWRPSLGRSHLDHVGNPVSISDDDLNQILAVIGHSLASGTQETYGSGLLAFHVFCDVCDIPEVQ
jgi:hypothetical protein